MHKNLKQFFQIGMAIVLALVIIILTQRTIPIITGFVSFIFSLVSPFIAGFVIAYLFVGLVDFFVERARMKRIFAVSLVFFGFLGIITVVIITLFPILTAEIQRFITYLPELWDSLDVWVTNFYIRYDFIPDNYQLNIHEIGERLRDWIDFTPKIDLSRIFNAFSVLFLTPVATFYFLLEFPSIKRNIKRFLTRNKQFTLIRYLRDLDKGMGQYLKGLMVIINILMLLATILFWSIGLEYALLFGFLIGYLDIIPYFGPWIGGAPAVIFAFTKDIRLGILVLIICISLQIVESNIITPFVQGKTTQIKPLYIVIALTVFGKIFGILGMIAAVPLLYFFILTIHYLRMFIRIHKIRKLKPDWYKTPA